MIRSMIAFATALLAMGIVESFHVDCNYHTNSYLAVDEIYECAAHRTINVQSKESLDWVSGYHDEGKNNNDVAGLIFDDKTIHYFPTDIENHFSNLRVILIESCNLKEIHKEDLKPFPKLEYAGFYDNKIQVLEKDLLEYNPQLKVANFGANKLLHVESTVFNMLPNLRYLFVHINPCIDMKARDDVNKVNEVKTALETKCKDQTYSAIKEQLENIEKELKLSYVSTDKIIKVDNDLKRSQYNSQMRFKNKLEELKNINLVNSVLNGTEISQKDLKDISYLLILQMVREMETIKKSVQLLVQLSEENKKHL